MAASAHMRRALELAAQARHRTNPNPMVGAVVVRDGEVVGEGFHERAGEAHAEVAALAAAGDRARGATIYVTLEPCSFQGRTGACAPLLVDAGLARAVVAMEDPHPLVSGTGIKLLTEAGLEVEVGDGLDEAEALNRRWLTVVRARRPFVALKFAMSLDGKIATSSGRSRWITGEAARLEAHRLRTAYDGVAVGAGTVLADDPALTARSAEGTPHERQPRRVVVDGRLRTPADARVLAGEAPAIVLTSPSGYEKRGRELEGAGAIVETLQGPERVDIHAALRVLYGHGIQALLVEGGGDLAASFAEAGVVDHVYGFVAPSLIGGWEAPSPVDGKGAPDPSDALKLQFIGMRELGGDVLLEAVPA